MHPCSTDRNRNENLEEMPEFYSHLPRLTASLASAENPVDVAQGFFRFFGALGYSDAIFEGGTHLGTFRTGDAQQVTRCLSPAPTLVFSLDGNGSRGSSFHPSLRVANRAASPPDLSPTLKAVLEALGSYALQRISMRSRTKVPPDEGGTRIIGEHPLMQRLLQQAARYAKSKAPVLIVGETGTGKELLARWIHEHSRRSQGPWVAVNCATLKPELAESQLFGHRKGTFTGATHDLRGFVRDAHRGTLFLDEISCLPLEVQPRLLRVLEEGKILPLGETREQPVDMRVVAATNQDLAELCEQGTFRWDVFFRLQCLRLHIPPLRERLSDVPHLVHFCLDELRKKEGLEVHISGAVLEWLQTYSFPGNVRQLRNLIYAAAWSAPTGIIRLEDVLRQVQGVPDAQSPAAGPDSNLRRLWQDLAEGRRNFWDSVATPFLQRDLSRKDVMRLLEAGLETTNGNYRKLAELLGVRNDYKRFLAFLSYHHCKPDFRRFRS